MQSFMIPMNLIKASIHCAAVKDVRYYLNGALFEYTSSDKKLRVISTNGNVMSCFSIYTPECEEVDFSIIIPIETLKLSSKVKSKFIYLKSIENQYSLEGFLFKPGDGRFPDYRRVIPKTLSGEPGQYQPELVLSAQNALRDYYESKKTTFPMNQNGTNAAVIHNGYDDAMVVVMPCRFTDKNRDNTIYVGFN